MSNFPSLSRLTLTAGSVLLVTIAGCSPMAAQSVSSFISSVESDVQAAIAALPAGKPIIFGTGDVFGYGSSVASWNPQIEIDVVDGLKALGAQRIEFNPGVTTINNSTAVTNLDALVHRVRQLGLRLAINPEFMVGEISVTSFSDFTNVAMQTYPQLAARYQPDNFVIVHEPTTQTARMGITGTVAEWDAFIKAVAPLIKAASPHTRVGAGDCTNCNEESYFSDFADIPTCEAMTESSACLDFLTMDLYSAAPSDFAIDVAWAAIAHTSGKGVYMEETFAPTYLPAGSTVGQYQGSPTGAEGAAIIGSCDSVFEQMDQTWLEGIAKFDQANGMESMTDFVAQAFFLYSNAGAPPADQCNSSAFIHQVSTAVQNAQLTSTAKSYQGDAAQMGIKTVTSTSNASYAALPTIFNPSCGTADNPCNANSIVAPDMLVSAFGLDLANTTITGSNFPTSLGGTSATLVDSTGASIPVQLYSVSPTQVNYLMPSNAAPGPGLLTVTSGDGTVTTGVVLVAPVAPGLYTSFANGTGPASAVAVCMGTCSGWPNSLGNGQFWQYTFIQGCTSTSSSCTQPLSWGDNDFVVVELYGTGVRHRATLSDITAAFSSSAGNTSAQVQYADKQGTDTGLDQINVLVPQSLRGAGTVSLSITGQYTDPATQVNYPYTSNSVSLELK